MKKLGSICLGITVIEELGILINCLNDASKDIGKNVMDFLLTMRIEYVSLFLFLPEAPLI